MDVTECLKPWRNALEEKESDEHLIIANKKQRMERRNV